jgi:hypothetical protein
MALMYCRECGQLVSGEAPSCPHCGVPNPTGAASPRYIHPAQTAPTHSAGLAAVLSLIIPGAGQMYRGRVGAGLLWLVFVVIGYSLFIVPGFVLHVICIFNAASSS